MTTRRFKVMQVIDSLDAGGAERVAVNLANELAARGQESYLCATRRGGVLESSVDANVRVLHLGKRHTVDVGAARRLRRYIVEERIDLIHAHSTSVFLSAIAAHGKAIVIWHDHYGVRERNPVPLRMVRPFITGVVSVNSELRNWAIHRVGFRATQVFELPNFVNEAPSQLTTPALPGKPGFRVVCVANLRPEKGHRDLITAMAKVVEAEPDAHLICVGAEPDQQYAGELRAVIRAFALERSVSLMGPQEFVLPLLRASAIGVLSSHSEGFPLALLEYGLGGVGVVATDVGESKVILEAGRHGLVVPRGDLTALGNAILHLLRNPAERDRLGESFREKVVTTYTAEAVVPRLLEIYEHIDA